MSKAIAFSSKIKVHDDPIEIPPRWLDCARKSTIIAGKFLAFKTPLDNRYKEVIPKGKQWTCNMLIENVKDDQKNLGLVIDLTNTERYYKSDVEFIGNKINYQKIRCQGHNETPTDGQIDRFIQICHDFVTTNPEDIIGVHCTHGFNRTGFLICAYLCRQLNYRIDIAIDLFAKARPSGIYKQDYLNKLNQKFGKDKLTWNLTPSPTDECCLKNKSTKPDDRKRSYDNKRYEQSNKRFRESNPKFAVDLIDVKSIYSQPLLDNIRSKCQKDMCGWTRQSFPGSQPISMDHTNYQTILLSPYMVSWKADGTRYMMLIENENAIYMLDRKNDVFQISHLSFPKDSDCTKHLTNTLVDGEFVTDNDKGIIRYRYLIYDIIFYDNEYVGQKPFSKRLDLCRHIVDARNKACERGRINKTLEPFSIKDKGFWELSTVSKLLGNEFQSQITHGMDGLIFQPELDPYRPGRSPRVFKWKEDNTIDFRLKIDRKKSSNNDETRALLYLHNQSDPFATMCYSPELDQYDNEVVECSYRNGDWYFYRHRPDKTYPNVATTADGILKTLQHPISKDILCSLIEEHIAFVNY